MSDLLRQAADLVTTTGFADPGNLQRRLRIGYARAQQLLDQLEQQGVVGPSQGSIPRDVFTATVPPGTSDYTVTTAGGAQVEVSTCPDRTIIVCLSGCRTCLTFYPHLSDNHAAEAKGYANGHAGACNATPIGGA